MKRPCLSPRCPYLAVHRGYCQRHRQSTTARSYGAEHQRERAAALPGARCEACGSTRDLQRDHILPASLGGSQHPSNKRWLCSVCHGRIGVRRDRGPSNLYRRGASPLTRLGLFPRLQVPSRFSERGED